MTLKPTSNGLSLPKAPYEKSAFIEFAKRLLHLQPDCSVVDLDKTSNQYVCPPDSDLGIWIDSWHAIVDALGTSDDAESGVVAARHILYDLSCRFEYMIFSADTSRPPLDQFGSPNRSLEMLFRESTCYTSVVPVAFYRGRKIYLGSSPDRRSNTIQKLARM